MKSEKIKRFIVNKYDINKIDIKTNAQKISEQILLAEKNSDKNYPPTMSTSINSLGEKEYETSFYTGTGGNIYIYWKQYLFYNKKKEYLTKFYNSLKTNLSIAEKENDMTNSFFMSKSGIYMFYCIYGIEIKNKEIFSNNFMKLIKLKSFSENKNAEVELLYGTTGYLYSLLFLKKYILSIENKDINSIFDKNMLKVLDETILNIFDILLNSGIKYMKNYNWDHCLLYPFPVNSKRPELYLGAAHGLIGAIYMLLSTIKFFPSLINKTISINSGNITISDLLLKNVKYIQSLQIKSTGNFPSDIEGEDSGDCVHFCHGCIGAIHLFLLSEEFFPNCGFKETAISCNISLWERGLLYKGNGVCHGMSGVVYGLIKLYKETKNDLYLKEAICICFGTFDKEVQKLVKGYKDPQRLARGIPDTPYSLMEGEGGCLVMYYDLMKVIEYGDKIDKNQFWGVFPGYEIF